MFGVAFLLKPAAVFTPRLPGLCSSERVWELQETNRMSVGGQMRGAESDKEVCVCVCINPRKDFL